MSLISRLSLIATAPFVFAAILQAGLVNGDFQTGDLTGWTSYTTAAGTAGSGLPNVVTFSTAGVDSLAAHFSAGRTSGVQFQGGGIYQDAVYADGLLTVEMDWAASNSNPGGGNAEGGRFSLLLDGLSLSSTTVGFIDCCGAIVRGSLSGSAPVTAGTHRVSIEITRNYSVNASLGQYVDNISTSITSSAPEPAGVFLLGSGLVAVLLRQRRGR